MRTCRLLVTAVCCLALAACGDDLDPQEAEVSPDAAAFVEVAGTDELLWRPPQLEAEAGPLDVRIECGMNAGHEFAILGVQDGATLATCEPAGTAVASVELEAGTYTFVCNVPGHRSEGMEGELVVR